MFNIRKRFGVDKPVNNFSDFADKEVLDGAKRKISTLLNQPITVLRFRISESHYKDKCLTIQFEQNGSHFVTFTGSAVLQDMCKKYADKMPFKAKIVRINNYFTFL